MASRAATHWLRILFRKLLLVILLAVVLFTLFTVFNHPVLHGFTGIELLLLEAGAIVLWSPILDDSLVRDRVMCPVLARLPSTAVPPAPTPG